MAVNITQDQLEVMLEISKDVQKRVKANGMPELDEDLAEMIELLEGASSSAPVIESLSPNVLTVPGIDTVLSVIGTGFTEESVINWNGGDEVTEFVDEEELTTIVRPSTVQAPLPFELDVYVKNGTAKSNIVKFTFTEVTATRRR
jgi:hypothetical protein